ncbi:MAG: hypothetical protein ABH881_04090 [bacterium]
MYYPDNKNNNLSLEENAPKKDKDFIVERQKVLEEEKKIRANNKDQVDVENDNIEIKTSRSFTDNVMNIVGVVVGKLSFLRDQQEEERVLKTNLIQDEASNFIEWNKYLKTLIKYSSFSLVFSVIIFVALFFWQQKVQKYGEGVNDNIARLDQVITSEENKVVEIRRFSNKVDLVNTLIRRHIKWTNFFKFLEENTIANVSYANSFSGDINGSYSFQSKASDYGAMAAQIKLLREQEEVLAVNSDSVRALKKEAGGGVAFSLEVKLKNNIFRK